ncbi:heme-thiolate peroxidase, partial [Scytalidium lignicola]
MRVVILISVFLSLGSEVVHGFSSKHAALHPHAVSKLSSELHSAFRRASEKRLLSDPLTTPIEVIGEHSFIPPNFDAGDQRGPCPGLNALANHGYISRHGVTSMVEVTAAINEVWGMGLDLAGILAVMGTVFVGNPLSLDPGFSIGGETGSSENLLGNVFGLLGTPRGLLGSHNIIESDSSITRDDLYVTGDASTLNLSKFNEWYKMSNGTGDYNMDLMADLANIRFQETIATNPNFYFGPFTGMIARNAGFLFAGRLFANHSVENPTGVLTKEIIKSIFGVSGPEGNFKYNKGWERIPENWYRRPVDYGLVDLNLDTLAMVAKYPQLGSIGGNTGTVNSFTGVDLGNLTGGVFNVETLLEGNNLLCFSFEVVKTLAPNSLSTLFSVLDVPLQLITDTVGSALLNFACPALSDLTIGGQSFEKGIQKMFPGAAKSKGAF